MTAYEAFKLYAAVNAHINSTYDYFKYGGKLKAASPEAFEKSPHKRMWLKLSQNRSPKTFIIGNLIYNEEKWPTYFIPSHQLEYEKYLEKGMYLFKQDLVELKHNFGDNFVVDSKSSIPYILKLVRSDEISIHTACVFESLLSCNDKWCKSDQFLIFSNLSKKISKITPFFGIQNDKYRAIVTDYFRNKS